MAKELAIVRTPAACCGLGKWWRGVRRALRLNYAPSVTS